MRQDHRQKKPCPWWLAYTFDNPLRRIIHPPRKILADYLLPGTKALDLGCGFGHFSLGMAHMVGDQGKVIAADLQQKMLDKTMTRAALQGIEHRIIPLPCSPEGLNLREEVDFVLACNVLHEIPYLFNFLNEISMNLKAGGKMYIMEPKLHVGKAKLGKELEQANKCGFVEIDRPGVKGEQSVVLELFGK